MVDPRVTRATDMDRKVHAWLEDNLGPVTDLVPHPRWRTGWDAVIERGGKAVPLYIRGPRGETYVSPVGVRQEAAIHRALLAGGIPVPKVLGVIDDPESLVLERLPGRIDTATIEDEDARRRVREEFVDIVARQHGLPLDLFDETGISVPVGADAVSRNLYAASEAIFDRLVDRPWPLLRFVGGWLRRNVPVDRTRAAFIHADSGQFLFDGDRVTGLIDFEMSGFGDPAAELAGLRLRDTSEPLGDLGALYDRYERITGDRISKRLIEYHTAGYCGVNGFMLWPLAFRSAAEQDYAAYLNFAVATSRWCVTAMAAHDRVELTDTPQPAARPMGFEQAGRHLVRQIEAAPTADAAAAYARDSAAALARYQHRWLTFGADVLATDLDEAEALLGTRPSGQDEMMAQLEQFVLQAGAESDAQLIRHFHRWLQRQSFLLEGCGIASYNVGLDLQVISPR